MDIQWICRESGMWETGTHNQKNPFIISLAHNQLKKMDEICNSLNLQRDRNSLTPYAFKKSPGPCETFPEIHKKSGSKKPFYYQSGSKKPILWNGKKYYE